MSLDRRIRRLERLSRNDPSQKARLLVENARRMEGSNLEILTTEPFDGVNTKGKARGLVLATNDWFNVEVYRDGRRYYLWRMNLSLGDLPEVQSIRVNQVLLGDAIVPDISAPELDHYAYTRVKDACSRATDSRSFPHYNKGATDELFELVMNALVLLDQLRSY